MFSELVDRAVHIAGRPDALVDIVYGANETMRNICKKGDWHDDSCEEAIPILDDSPSVIWQPNVGRAQFRREEYVEYDGGCEPTKVLPSRRLQDLHNYYYRSGDKFVFVGATTLIKVYYYRYQPWLKYSLQNNRAVVWDGAEYLKDGAPTTDAADIASVSNWMLERHNDTVLAGTLAHFFATKQDPRQQTQYSKYQQGIADITRSEASNELYGRRHG